jgi:hypothetical protein
MNWIVIGEENGKIKLVSKSSVNGMLPKGSYLTIEEGQSKFILRVDDSAQSEPFSPSPLIVEMDLSPLKQDRECQNILTSYRVKDMTTRADGLIDFIRPQSVARRSNQEEINLAIGSSNTGPPVFVATVHSSQNQTLRDEKGKPIIACIPDDMFFHQIMICGKTGSGKTVAAKYLAQHFVEKLEGAVLAINVKDVDFLMMNEPSRTTDPSILEEWKTLGQEPHGIGNYVVYYPANLRIDTSKGVDPEVCKKITLDVKKIDPDALTGLLQGISDTGALNFPNVFRYWQEEKRESGETETFTFGEFLKYFGRAEEDKRVFNTRNSRGEISEITMHKATYDNIMRNLDFAVEFFDNEDASCLTEDDILLPGKMSIINVAGSKGIQFGSILLRDLLHRIVEAKTVMKTDVPVLIIIDEVHQFYNTESSREALGDLDTICRTGRSMRIGVVFSSQNPSDIPRGLSNVVNTKIFFKSDAGYAKQSGVRITDEEMESLRKGYAVASIHELSLLKVVKFPLSFAGVFESRRIRT